MWLLKPFYRVRFVRLSALLPMLAALPLFAGHGGDITSTVSVDKRTGRLVRRMVIPERVIQARIVPSIAVGEAVGSPVRLPVGSEPVNEMVDELSAQHGVDPLLVHAVIHCESAYNRLAVSPKGAEGLMQLIPDTARRYGVKNSFDSRQNIEGGVRYLSELQGRYDDLRLVLAAYNAGEGAVDRYRGIPPYAETQEYVYKVGKRFGDLRRMAMKRAAAGPAKVAKASGEPEYRPLDSYMDAEGRLSLRTR
jgi:hypothetical protein